MIYYVIVYNIIYNRFLHVKKISLEFWKLLFKVNYNYCLNWWYCWSITNLNDTSEPLLLPEYTNKKTHNCKTNIS